MMQFLHHLYIVKGQDSLKTLLSSQCCMCKRINKAALNCDPGKDFCSCLRYFELRNWLYSLRLITQYRDVTGAPALYCQKVSFLPFVFLYTE